MGVFDDIPAWARQPAQPMEHMAAQATTSPMAPVQKKRGRPPGAKDSKPRARLAPLYPRPKEPDDGNAA